MSTTARIDELRKKFDENPRRYFAPLANELRKAGDLVQAIALCREHLPKQPGHMSGYIVFGQALYEAGTLEEARTVFEQALSLDPENLIALRHLGDIAKAGGDNATARRWYERVLDADPRNDDIAAQLDALSAMATPARSLPPVIIPYVPTPPVQHMALGLGAVPTPDAALRAVDFDVVNARINHYEPLDLDAIEATAPGAAVSSPPDAQAPDALPVDAPEAYAEEDRVDDGRDAVPEDADRDVRAEWSTPPLATASPTATPTPMSFTPVSLTPISSPRVVPTPASFTPVSATPLSVTPLSVTPLSVTPLSVTPLSSPAITPTPLSSLPISATPLSLTPVVPLSAVPTPAWSEPSIAQPVDRHDELDAFGAPVEDVADGNDEHGATTDPVASNDVSPAAASGGESLRAVDDALGAFAAHDPALAMQDADAPDRSYPTATGMSAADADAYSASVRHLFDADAPHGVAESTDFEEGILAPEWPDTSALMARVLTPRNVTPASVESTPEAVEAFGREAHDPQPAMSSADADADGLAAELGGVDSIDDVTWIAPPESPSLAADDEVPAPDAPLPYDPLAGWNDDPESPELQAQTDDQDLPWLSAAVESEVEAAREQAHDLEELADAFAQDAAAVGDDTAVRMSSVDVEPAGSSAVSFADVLDDNAIRSFDETRATSAYAVEAEVSEVESIEDAEPHSERVESSGFVTETMAELLVSQGFIARAATVYEELVRRHPYDPVLTSRLDELRALLDATAEDAGDEATDEVAATANERESEQPVAVESHSEAPTEMSSEDTDVESSVVEATFDADTFDAPDLITSVHATPAYATPAYPTPAYATPAFATPAQASPSFERGSGGTAVLTARERYAQLAARRVPRRTPPNPTPIVVESEQGLATLFGSTAAGAGDDAAARALADAFAPIDEDDAPGIFDFGETEQDRAARAPGTSPVARDADSPVPTSGPSFSFDRFFPDPAASPPVASVSDEAASPAANSPVGEDLAQFSAWLKGLGTT